MRASSASDSSASSTTSSCRRMEKMEEAAAIESFLKTYKWLARASGGIITA